MTTDTTFPVAPGDEITVKCPDGFINQGSETITCQNGIHYKFNVQPRCEAKSKNFNLQEFEQSKNRNFSRCFAGRFNVCLFIIESQASQQEEHSTIGSSNPHVINK